jgi:serine/threonine protein kinase
MQEQQEEQEGGKLLGQGIAGCVFDPPLKCAKTKRVAKPTKHSKVGKLTSPTEALKELTISKELEGYDRYFALVESICTPLPKYKQTEKGLNKCESMKGAPMKQSIQLMMPFAGTPFYLIPHRPDRIHLLPFAKHLLTAGTMLLSRRIVHTDIHDMNLLVDSPSTCRIIDMGRAYRADNIESATLLQFQPKNEQTSPELLGIYGVLDDMPEDIVLARIQDELYPLKLVYKLFGVSPAEQIKELATFARESRTLRNRDIETFFKLYWSKFDAWSLGAILLTLYVDLSMHNGFQPSQPLLKVIRGMCETDPSKRLDAAEALAILDPEAPILKTPSIKKWLKNQEVVRKEISKLS